MTDAHIRIDQRDNNGHWEYKTSSGRVLIWSLSHNQGKALKMNEKEKIFQDF